MSLRYPKIIVGSVTALMMSACSVTASGSIERNTTTNETIVKGEISGTVEFYKEGGDEKRRSSIAKSFDDYYVDISGTNQTFVPYGKMLICAYDVHGNLIDAIRPKWRRSGDRLVPQDSAALEQWAYAVGDAADKFTTKVNVDTSAHNGMNKFSAKLKSGNRTYASAEAEFWHSDCTRNDPYDHFVKC